MTQAITVELLHATDDALNLLLRTKNTRLGNTSDPGAWTEEQKFDHLEYMRDTIKSSWEFVDFTFRISGVTRAFTHQLVRTRAGSYAQESQRTVDVSGHDVVRPELPENLEDMWDDAVGILMKTYGFMLSENVPAQDARGILPTNITTSIVAKFDLRSLHEMSKVRLCTRTQGEYQTAFRLMRDVVIAKYDWTEEFIQPQCVADGTCAFPRYGRSQCPVWIPALAREDVKKEMRTVFWRADRFAANPKAKGGMT